MPGTDTYDLQRFVDAQNAVYEQVRSELSQGRKTSHWMWFVFPQIAGLGESPMAARYAIRSIDEARAYLHHPVLGDRLHECAGLLLAHAAKPIGEILTWPDDVKLNSSMTLFSRAAGENERFVKIIESFFDGEFDRPTLDRLSRSRPQA